MTAWTQTQVSSKPALRLAPPAGAVGTEDPVGSPADADAGVVEELFRGGYPQLVNWLRRRVDDDSAHEIASEAFLRLLARSPRVARPREYLYVIAANLVRDQWRKSVRERRAIGQISAEAAASAVCYPAQDVDVRCLIASLPSRLREPFLLHYFGGFLIREVAVLLSKPEGTVKADLFAARARLRQALQERAAA